MQPRIRGGSPEKKVDTKRLTLFAKPWNSSDCKILSYSGLFVREKVTSSIFYSQLCKL